LREEQKRQSLKISTFRLQTTRSKILESFNFACVILSTETSPPDTLPAVSNQPAILRKKKLRRWGLGLAKAGIWFGIALIITAYVRDRLPAHPVIVHTNSIDTGIYWLDLKPRALARGQFITFDFNPSTPELRANFKPTRHTKMLWGLPGDVVKADETGAIQVCHVTAAQTHGLLEIDPSKPDCVPAGLPRDFDSQGRPLIPWLKAGEQYQLTPEEYWVYAPNPKSLDSRYNGPIQRKLIRGVAKPIWVWQSWED